MSFLMRGIQLEGSAWIFRHVVVFTPQACRDYLDIAESHSRRWQKALQYEREQRHHLEETIEQLAKQHNSLERAWRENPTSYTGETHHSVCLLYAVSHYKNMALFWPVTVMHVYHWNVAQSDLLLSIFNVSLYLGRKSKWSPLISLLNDMCNVCFVEVVLCVNLTHILRP